MEQQQQAPEAPAFGRKIFFLNPSFSIRSHIIENLKKLEYEVYTFTDYRRVKGYLRIHHDAILYINPETQMNIPAWLNFIRTIKEDSTFSTTIIGVLTDHLNPIELKALTDSPHITAGIFHVEGNFKAILPSFCSMLDSQAAKGRRKYVRTLCTAEDIADFLWIQNGKMFKSRILDISTASIAILIPQTTYQVLSNFSEIFCTLQLGSKQIQTRAKKLVIKPNGNAFAAIFMIDESTPQEAIDMIREYVFDTLERNMLKSVDGLMLDKSNYAV